MRCRPVQRADASRIEGYIVKHAAKTSLAIVLVCCAAALLGCHGGEAILGPTIDDGDSTGAEQLLVRGVSVALVDSQGNDTTRVLTIPGVTALPGSVVQMQVNLNSISGVAGFQAEVTFDPAVLRVEDVAITDGIPGEPLQLSNIDNATGSIAVAVAGTQDATGASATLLEITFSVSADAPSASTQVGVSVTLANAEAQIIGTTLVGTGDITIAAGYPGDMDGDGQPTILDVVQILRIVIGADPETPVADANQDGVVNITDAMLMVRCVIGIEPWPIGVIDDAEPLQILSTAPEDGATGVATDTTLVITFNAAVEPTSFTYTIAEEGDGTAPAMATTWNAPDYTAVTLTPQTALSAGTTYTVSGIGATPADTLSYEALSGGEFSFTTAVGDGAPTVEITSPTAGVTVSGLIQVGVAAQPGSGNTQIQRIEVEFGDQTQVLEAASGTVTFNSCYAINGEQSISAVATDSAGVHSECASVAVVVDNFAFYVDERVQVVAADAPGDSVTVPVRITDAAGGLGFSMTINYDAAVLSVASAASAASVTKGAAVPGNALLIVNALEPGHLYVSCAGTEEFDAAEQEILRINFGVVSSPVGGSTLIDLDDTEAASPGIDWVHVTRGTLHPDAIDGEIAIP